MCCEEEGHLSAFATSTAQREAEEGNCGQDASYRDGDYFKSLSWLSCLGLPVADHNNHCSRGEIMIKKRRENGEADGYQRTWIGSSFFTFEPVLLTSGRGCYVANSRCTCNSVNRLPETKRDVT